MSLHHNTQNIGHPQYLDLDAIGNALGIPSYTNGSLLDEETIMNDTSSMSQDQMNVYYPASDESAYLYNPIEPSQINYIKHDSHPHHLTSYPYDYSGEDYIDSTRYDGEAPSHDLSVDSTTMNKINEDGLRVEQSAKSALWDKMKQARKRQYNRKSTKSINENETEYYKFLHAQRDTDRLVKKVMALTGLSTSTIRNRLRVRLTPEMDAALMSDDSPARDYTLHILDFTLNDDLLSAKEIDTLKNDYIRTSDGRPFSDPAKIISHGRNHLSEEQKMTIRGTYPKGQEDYKEIAAWLYVGYIAYQRQLREKRKLKQSLVTYYDLFSERSE